MKPDHLQFGDILDHKTFHTKVMVIVKRADFASMSDFVGVLVDIPPSLDILGIMQRGEPLNLHSSDWVMKRE